ncbi:MAG: hypothetical protein GY761_03690 [Hyphomicrobiales bacterium]|nr:hypothetical protein [Hyphomicrobiales bacterium]
MGNPRKHSSNVEHWTKILRCTMEEPAWKALSTTAQSLYPWLKFEWRGPQNNNNGNIRLSVRQAAERMGVVIDTASKAFHDLQAKGFIVITKPARLGVGGEAKSPAYELTEIKLVGSDSNAGRKLYQGWQEGKDFAVHKTMANNPKGRNGKTKPCPNNHDSAVLKFRMKSK